MAPRGALPLSSCVVSVLLRLVVCQRGAINARENLGIAHGEPDHNNFPNSNNTSDSASRQASNTPTTAVIVVLAITMLLLVAGYAYRKMWRRRDSSCSTSSSRSKRKRERHPSTSSSTTFILAEQLSSPDIDSARELLAGDSEVFEVQDESRRHPRSPYLGTRLRDSSLPPRHGPRYIRQLDDNSFKQASGSSAVQEGDRSSSDGNEQVELRLRSTPGAEKPDEDPTDKPLSPQKMRRLAYLSRRTTGGDLDDSETNTSSYSPVHMLGPRDERMQKFLDKQKVVVTVEPHRRRSLGMAPSPPSEVPLRRPELAQPESMDDSFMKDLKRRRAHEACFSEDLPIPASTTRSVSAERLLLPGAAVQSDAAKATTAKSSPGKMIALSRKSCREAVPPTTARVTFGGSVAAVSTKEVQKRNARTVQQESGLVNTIGPPTAAEETWQPSQEEATTHLELTAESGHVIPTPDKSSMIAEFYNAKARCPWSPRSLRSSIAVDRTEADKSPRLAQYEKSSSAVARPIHFPVAVAAEGSNLYIKGTQSHAQHEDTRMSDPADSLPEKNSRQKRPTSAVLQDMENGANSAQGRGSLASCQNAALQDGLADDDKGGKKEKFRNDHIDIEKVGDLARLLSRLIRVPDKAEDASSDKDSGLPNVQRPIKSKGDKGKQSHTARTTVNTDAVVTAHSEENVAGIFPYFSRVISSGAHQKSADRKPSSAVHTDVGKAGLSQEQRASKQDPLMETFLSKGAYRQAPELLEVRAKRLDIKKRKHIPKDNHSRNKHGVTAKITKTKPCDKITFPGQSLQQTTTSETSTNSEKYGSDHTDGRLLEAVTFIAPQGCPGWTPIEAASATQRISVGEESFLLTGSLGSIGEATDISLNLSDIADMRNFLTNESSAFSTRSGTTPTRAPKKPPKEYTTKRLQPPPHTTKRPFSKVLASLEGQATEILNYNTTSGVQEIETAPNESSSGGARLSSSQLAIDYETLKEATYERISTGHPGTDSSMAFLNGGVREVFSSTGSSAHDPTAKVPASSNAVKTTSVDSDRASKESVGVLPTFFDSSEGTVPPSESVSLSFMSSISTSSSNALYRITDLADLARLECSAALVNRETGDGGAVLRIPVPRLASSSAVHTESSRHPALSFTERGALTQRRPEPAGRSGRLPLTQRHDIGLHIATSRPWTEDVEKVVMQGNKHYLGHHASRYPTAKLATSLEEAEYARLKVHGQGQPESPASPDATDALTSTSRPGDPTRESCEPTVDLTQRSTISSGSDLDTVEFHENNLEQPLKLSESILLQHPHVGLRDFNTIDFSWAPDSEGGAESKDETLEAQVKGEEALDLKTSPKLDADEQTSEKVNPANFSTTTVDYERWLEVEGAVSTRRTVDAAATRATEPIIRVTPPLSSEQRVTPPNSSVTRRFPGGLFRYGNPGQQGVGCGLTQSSATIRLRHGSPQVLLSTGMNEPTFESIYNAILQPAPEMVADPELNAPSAAPSSPRPTSPTQTSSCDGALNTALPIESPQDRFKANETDTIGTTGTGSPVGWCTSRLYSTRRRSLPDSSVLAPMAAPSVEHAESRSDAARETTRLGGSNGPTSVSACSNGTDNNAAGVEGPTPVQPDTLTDSQETPVELMSPFFSFDDTVSSVSIKADANVDRPGSLAPDKQD
ncbi:hypothetical protein HPB50_002719 [Hyalomma asiaticum]|uniref:Uncharacterized protein n=1 Tax=Hyalomma asiaticum TaxID=266040 RepID=A0ACB7TDZ5_HYAAI|nr:hypothetical protein HPB50_002719 [Hyalomma asiaticum]